MVLLPIPLDLHVLSLQLAFILSQDQTLHSSSLLPTSIRKKIHPIGNRLFLSSLLLFSLSVSRQPPPIRGDCFFRIYRWPKVVYQVYPVYQVYKPHKLHQPYKLTFGYKLPAIKIKILLGS
jgi:hypothetical protein